MQLHKACFEKWALAERDAGREVTCVFCRTPWIGIKKPTKYENSTFSPFIVCRKEIRDAEERRISAVRRDLLQHISPFGGFSFIQRLLGGSHGRNGMRASRYVIGPEPPFFNHYHYDEDDSDSDDEDFDEEEDYEELHEEEEEHHRCERCGGFHNHNEGAPNE